MKREEKNTCFGNVQGKPTLIERFSNEMIQKYVLKLRGLFPAKITHAQGIENMKDTKKNQLLR